jgi:hypothetical protein
MLRTFLLETRAGLVITTLIILGLAALALHLASTYGLGEYSHIFDR